MGSLPHREGEPFAILLNIRAIKKSGTLDFTRLQERHEASISVGVRFPARFQYTCCVSGRRRNPLHDGDTRFLLKWPSLQAVRKSNPATLKSFYYLNGSRSQTLLEQRLALLDKAVPVTAQSAAGCAEKSPINRTSAPASALSYSHIHHHRHRPSLFTNMNRRMATWINSIASQLSDV